MTTTNKRHQTKPAWKPAWKGPEEDGITCSLLSRFLVCRERFRLLVVEGLREDEGFNHAIEFGHLWHTCEEATAGGKDYRPALRKHTARLLACYPGSRAEIEKWSAICRLQYPIYRRYWAKHPSSSRRRYLLQESTFRVPYRLPSGRKVTLRGKWDAIFRQGSGVWLEEHKTKGQIDEEGLTRTLGENLQVMFYLIALKESARKIHPAGFLPGPSPGWKVKGVSYNVTRRPLSDRYAIRQRKSETLEAFHARLAEEIKAKPQHYFMRWKATISAADIKRFRLQVFDPILEQLWDWWEWVSADPDPWRPGYNSLPSPEVPGGGIHFRFPFGVYNSIAGGFRGDYFDYLTRGQTSGLSRVKTLFPELED